MLEGRPPLRRLPAPARRGRRALVRMALRAAYATQPPEEGEVLVRVRAAGVCRTDVHLLHDVIAGTRGPLVPGHEVAGIVHKVGPGVTAAHTGQAVVVHFELPCGRCRSCLRKRTNLGTEGATLGFTVPGGYAEFVCVPQDVVLAAPANLELAHAAVLPCSGATAHHAVVTLGGAAVVAVDVRPEARDAAKLAGADEAVAPDDALAAILAATKDRGADLVVDLVSTPA